VLSQFVLAGRKIAALTVAERTLLGRAITEVRSVSARTILSRKGEVLEFSTILLEGFLSRHVDDRQGHRQFVSLQVPGDLVDFHAYPMRFLDHDVAALSDARIALIPHSAIAAITRANADLARKLWFATLLDAALHRGWIFRLGRLDAPGRVCHFFAETAARLHAAGLATPESFFLPITHADLGEACSLTSVHVSRVLKKLRSAGICTFRDGEARIQDSAALIRMAQFDPAYLHLDDGTSYALEAADAVIPKEINRINAG
jgi:CRP-like cAMP-binding protein